MDTNVHVTIVFPGAVATDIAANSAAEQILNGMEHDRYPVMVGGDARTMDLLTRLAPERAARLAAGSCGAVNGAVNGALTRDVVCAKWRLCVP